MPGFDVLSERLWPTSLSNVGTQPTIVVISTLRRASPNGSMSQIMAVMEMESAM